MTRRTPINPHPWTVPPGFDQARLVEGHQRMLVCSGQDAVDAEGRPQHPGDMAGQRQRLSVNARVAVTGAPGVAVNVPLARRRRRRRRR
jgi:hypothetical protein